MTTIASLPVDLWHLYVDNLVHYKQNSWVDSIASTCRVLAFMMIVPFILLTLLDVASYVIARTLGVIDETKASTSGELEGPPDAAAAGASAAAIGGTGGGGGGGGAEPSGAAPAIVVVGDGDAAALPDQPSAEDVEGNPKLSGVDTFSPAPSQPGSPTLQRREFVQHAPHFGFGFGFERLGLGLGGGGSESGWSSGSSLQLDAPETRGGGREHEHEREPRAGAREDGEGDEGERHGDRDGDDEGGSGATTPREPAGHGSGGSSSGESSSSSSSSYAILDRDFGSEDAGVVLRRRTRQPGTGPDADDGAV